MHVSDVSEVLLVLARYTYCRLPFLYQLKNLCLNRAGKDGWPLWKALDELIEELFCSHLEVKRIAAILDEVVQELARVFVNTLIASLPIICLSHVVPASKYEDVSN
jgi:hypothetical protein